MSVSEDSDLTNNKYEDEELIWKNVTVLLADPHLDEYWSWWIPQDDLDMEEFKQNIEAIKGIGKVTYYDDHRRLLKDWIDNPPEFVFNQCDEGYMNKEEFESHLTSVMDILNIPYTGPGPEGLCAVKDKSIVRGAAMSVGVPVPTEVYIEEGASFRSAIPDTMVYPAFCKLANASGSMGVLQKCLAYNKEEAIAGLEELRRQHPHRPLLLQEYLSGREFSIAVVGNPELGDFEVFPPVEVDYAGLDTSKYAPVQLEEFKRDGNSEFWQQVKEIRADLTPEQLSALKSAAERMFIRTKCTDFARMDFRMDKNGVIKIMDVNPNCWLGGKYRMMAEWAGYTWPQVLRRIFLTAQKRHQLREKKRKERDEYEKSLSAKTKSQYEVPQV